MSDWRKEVKRDSRFLYAFDIESASPVEVEITGFEHAEAYCPGKGKGTLWCLKFKGAKKMLGINVTNGNLIEHVIGTADKEKWIGKHIILRVAECEDVRCIRVHAPGAKLPKQCKRFNYVDADPKKSTATKSTPPEQQQAQSGDNAGASNPSVVPEPGAPDIIEELDKVLLQGVILYDDYARAHEMADPEKKLEIDEDMKRFIELGDHFAAVRWLRRKVAGE